MENEKALLPQKKVLGAMGHGLTQTSPKMTTMKGAEQNYVHSC